MNLKVSLQSTATISLCIEDYSSCCDVAAGVVISRQPLSGKDVPQPILLLLDWRNSKELETRRCWQNQVAWNFEEEILYV